MTARRRASLLLVGLGAATVPLDTAVNVAFPAITRGFDLPLAAIQWVVICYILTHASLLLAFGRVGDILGHARVFRAGLVTSAAAFVLDGLAPSYGALLLCRALQGVGAGLVISCAPALVAAHYPEAERSRAAGFFTMIFALGSALGPLVGGVLVEIWDWPAVFWFRAPVALAALLLPARDGPPAAGEREPMDVAGALLLALGLTALLLAGNRLQDGSVLAGLPLLAAALASLALFVRRERRVAHPVIDLAVFRVPGFALASLGSLVVNVAAFAVLLLAPYFLARLTALSVAASGVVLAAAYAGTVAASPLGGRLLGRVPASALAVAGALGLGAGLALVGSWRAGTPVWALVAPLVLQGAGLGLFQVAYLDIVLARLPRHRHGVAGSLAMLTQRLGVVVGAALLTLVFARREAALLADGAAAPDAFLAGFGASFAFAASLAAAVAVALAAAEWVRPRR